SASRPPRIVWHERTIRTSHATVTVVSQCDNSPSSCRLKSAVSLNSIRADTPSRPVSGWVGFLSRMATSHIGSVGSALHPSARRRSDSKFRCGGPQIVLALASPLYLLIVAKDSTDPPQALPG